jgi:hypothetical protein
MAPITKAHEFKRTKMRSRKIAIAGSVAALAFAAAPAAALAAHSATHHDASKTERVDRSRDANGVHHVDKKSVDKNGADSRRDR